MLWGTGWILLPLDEVSECNQKRYINLRPILYLSATSLFQSVSEKKNKKFCLIISTRVGDKNKYKGQQINKQTNSKHADCALQTSL